MSINGHQLAQCIRRRTTLGLLSCFALGIAVAACSSPTTSVPASADAGSADSVDGGQRSSDAGGGSDASNTAAGEKPYCDALASRSACPNGAVTCEAPGKCIYGLMSAAAAPIYTQCLAAPSCKNEDTCLREAALSVGGMAATTYESDCQARYSACGKSFPEDACAPDLFAFDGGAAVQACLTKPCEEIGECMSSLDVVKAIAACK